MFIEKQADQQDEKLTGEQTAAGEAPKSMGVILCECGGEIGRVIDLQALSRMTGEIPEVVYIHREAYPCSRDGQDRLIEAIREHNLDRVLVAGCSPRLVRNLFRETAVKAGLKRSDLNMVNIREHCAYLHSDQPEAALAKAQGLVEMGAIRLATGSPALPRSGKIIQSALVIGTGLSGLTLALSLADSGYQVTLLDQAGAFGEAPPDDLREETRLQIIEKGQSALTHPLIETLFNARVLEVTGHPGEYEVVVEQGEKTLTLAVGAIVVGNAARHKNLGGDQWFDRSRVKTQAEFQDELKGSQQARQPLALNNIVFILCAEPSQKEHCSRVCCRIGIRQAIEARKLNPNADITVLFRDLYLGSMGGANEQDLVEARKLGITFFRYRMERPPVIGTQTVDILDTLTGEPVRIPYDRVVMSMPLVPQDNTHQLASILGLPLDEKGFLAEPRLRLRPGRYAERGVFALGSAKQPADTDEALLQAYLTSARVSRFFSQENLLVETPAAWIDPALCTGCGNCPQVCPAAAIHLEKTDGVLSRSEIDGLRCFGCGNCVVVCPTKAITLPGWDNVEIPAQIQAALQSRSFRKGTPKVIVLACEWSAYASADVAGARYKESHDPRLSYPANVRIIRMNCSARFDPYHILWAFLNEADGVFLGACPPGECHYGTGNLYAQERVEILKKALAQYGMDPGRLHLEFMSVDDGARFAQKLTRFVENVTEMGAEARPAGLARKQGSGSL
jgi:heterodisulfide reductase subunit A2